MSDKSTPPSDCSSQAVRAVPDQRLLEAMLAATPAQRLAWLEKALCVAYASGALKPKRLIEKEEWEGMNSLPRYVLAITEERMAVGINQYLHAGKSAKKISLLKFTSIKS